MNLPKAEVPFRPNDPARAVVVYGAGSPFCPLLPDEHPAEGYRHIGLPALARLHARLALEGHLTTPQHRKVIFLHAPDQPAPGHSSRCGFGDCAEGGCSAGTSAVGYKCAGGGWPRGAGAGRGLVHHARPRRSAHPLKISTPHLHPNGVYMDLYLETPNGLYLTDLGETKGYLADYG